MWCKKCVVYEPGLLLRLKVFDFFYGVLGEYVCQVAFMLFEYAAIHSEHGIAISGPLGAAFIGIGDFSGEFPLI